MQRWVLLKICHSVAIRVVRNTGCIAEIVLVGDRDPGSKQWCTNSSERRVFHMCTSQLASDESLSRQQLGAVAAGELNCFSAHIRLREPDKSEDKAEQRCLLLLKGKREIVATIEAAMVAFGVDSERFLRSILVLLTKVVSSCRMVLSSLYKIFEGEIAMEIGYGIIMGTPRIAALIPNDRNP
ncbi:hypothetical protein GW17_00060562 [Ensete ventricosum]|nr:hypothetical protein GW17_00060562 [Ensete ventricosum]RZR75954.1 hypothetical protein BHM03_00000539 [Ensete ventricosum]